MPGRTGQSSDRQSTFRRRPSPSRRDPALGVQGKGFAGGKVKRLPETVTAGSPPAPRCAGADAQGGRTAGWLDALHGIVPAGLQAWSAPVLPALSTSPLSQYGEVFV